MAVWLRARAELRARLRSWIAIALLVSLAGGVVIAAAAGARRTETAFDRAAKEIRPNHLTVGSGGDFGFADLDLDRVARLPQVVDAAREDYPLFGFAQTDGGRKLSAEELGLLASPDPRYGVDLDAFEIIDGRRADPTRVEEAVVGETAAERFGLHPGSTVELAFYARDQLAEFATERSPRPTGPRLRFHVVGAFEEFALPGGGESDSPMLASSAFYRKYRGSIAMIDSLAVRLRHGEADLQPFRKGVDDLAKGGSKSVFTSFEATDQLERSAHFVAAALWLLAALGAVAGIVILGQAVARQVAIQATEHQTLRALGLTPRQLLEVGMAQAALVGIAAVVIGAALAVALSPIAPLGHARDAEPDPGPAFDGLVLGAGSAGLFVLVLAVSAAAFWRAARAPRATSRAGVRGGRPGVATRLARLGLPVTAVVGARLALDRGSGPASVPVGSALAGVVLAVATLTTALIFTASLHRLESTPRLYGQNWDVQAGDGVFGGEAAADVYPALRQERAVTEFSGGTIKPLTIEGEDVQVLGFEKAAGSVTPTVIEGRAPSRPDEVMLAGKTMDALDATVGGTVSARYGSSIRDLRVVGRGVLPELGQISLGRGAAVTFAGLRRLIPTAPRNLFMIRFRPGTDVAATKSRLGAVFEDRAAGSLKPRDVTDFSEVSGTSFGISALIGAIALATLVHVLVSTIRRRGRELAILKALGMERSQVLRTVGWQASTHAVCALLVGIPLGLAAGRWGWRLFADGLGVAPVAVVPVPAVLLVIPGAILVANLTAAVPGWIAARTPPALVLRAE